MAKKKARQHYVPKVYLKPFVDPHPPTDWPSDRPFQPAVWVLDPAITSPAERRSPSNILWENSLYTLASDDPSAPVLEEGLSRLESLYGGIQPLVLSQQSLTSEQYHILTLFIAALHGRVPGQLQHWQETIDEIKRLSLQMSDLPPVGATWEDFEEFGNKSLVTRTSAYAQVVAEHGFPAGVAVGRRGQRRDILFVRSAKPPGRLHRDAAT